MAHTPEFLARIADIGVSMQESQDIVDALREKTERLRKQITAREGWCDPGSASVKVAATVPGNEAVAAEILRLEALMGFFTDLLLTESSSVARENKALFVAAHLRARDRGDN
jgi:hypothetical protein